MKNPDRRHGFVRAIIGTALGFALLGASPLSAAEPTVLTVTGAISSPNRPAYNAFSDSLFGGLKLSFDKAREFSLKDLQQMPQVTLKVRYRNWPRDVTVKGPRLKEVLRASGASGATILVRSVDGYAPEFTLAEINAGQHVLALEADGKPLGVGGRGPLWLVYPPEFEGGQPVNDDGLAWAVFNVESR